MRRAFAAIAASLALALLPASIAHAQDQEEVFAGLTMEQALSERVEGSPDAPILMTEFASLTCPHCAALNRDTLPRIVAEYVDTGLVRIVKRDYPLDQLALTAAVAARCVPEERFFDFTRALYVTQSEWARSSDPLDALRSYARVIGMTNEQFEACVTNEALIEGVLEQVLDARETYEISATPTVIITAPDGTTTRTLRGAQPFEAYAAVFEEFRPADAPAAVETEEAPVEDEAPAVDDAAEDDSAEDIGTPAE